MSAALLVVDVQRALVEGETAVPGAAGLLARIGALLSRAREAGALVVHVQDHGDVLTRPGTPGWELALEVHDGEAVVAKASDDAFHDTGLDDLLRGAGVDGVVVVGAQSEMCVAATARGALARGFTVVLPRGAHATYDVPDEGIDAPGVPAAQVSRVAEWSLGDTVESPGWTEVRFG